MSLKLNSNSINYNVATVLDLTSIVNPSINDTVVVTEEGRGGVFIYRADGTSNGGTIFDSSGTGKWHRQYEGSVNVKWFGANGDGVSDDTLAIQNALDIGGVVSIDSSSKYLIDSTLTIPHHTSIVGTYNNVGTTLNNTTCPYGTLGSCLIINSTATINMSGSSSIAGVLIYRKGMVFPALDATLFSGTAITVSGDDVKVSSTMILGFNKAIYSSGAQRPRITDVQIDCTNGVEISACYDIAYLSNIHCWPFSTITTGDWAKSVRTGKAFYFHSIVDWARVDRCFSWGYNRGFHLLNSSSCSFNGCGADNANDGISIALNTGSMGFSIEGSSHDTLLNGCYTAAGQTCGIFINTTNNSFVTNVVNTSMWGFSTHGILVYSGAVNVNNCSIRNVANGISTTVASSYISAVNSNFNAVTIPINPAVYNGNIILKDNRYGNYTASLSSNIGIATIASSTPLTLPTLAQDDYIVSGTTNFGTLNGGYRGRVITLYFSNILTIYNGSGATSNMRLSGGTNYTSSNGSTLTLKHNGVQWYEIGRSV